MNRLARSLLRGASVLLFGSSVVSCASSDRGPDTTVKRESVPQWQDVFDGTPEIYAVVRPQAIKRDAVYGALFKTVLQMAQARSEMRGVTTLEALEGCDEIVLGIKKDANGEDAALVFRGVPASLDAARMTDSAGHPVFRLVDPRARVPEYEWIQRRNAETGAVFVLPDRTWVGTIGDSRVRARQAFAAPFGRPAPKADPQALAMVRFDAATFLHGPRFAKSPVVGPLTRKLRALTLALMPAKGGAVATLQYEDEDASAWAEMHVKRVIEELATARPTLAWLKEAKVGHEGNAVIVKVAVPTRLLEDLPKANSGDLAL
jgi:hypothetical protein